MQGEINKLSYDSDDSIKDLNYLPSDESSDEEDKILANQIIDGVNGENVLQLGSNETSNETNSDVEQLEETLPVPNSRKRIKQTETWKVTKRIKATLSGKEHISKSGKTITAKFMKPACAPCRKKYTEKINEEARLQIFESYWDSKKPWDMKRQFIRLHVTTKPTNRHRPKDNSRGNQRNQTISYNFDVKSENFVQKIDVCKLFFLNTLGISETVVRTALKKDVTGGFVSPDMRGRHVPPNKLSDEILNGIRSHINSFPAYESHYTRERSSKKYLGPELNKEKMYKLYQAKCAENGVPRSKLQSCGYTNKF